MGAEEAGSRSGSSEPSRPDVEVLPPDETVAALGDALDGLRSEIRTRFSGATDRGSAQAEPPRNARTQPRRRSERPVRDAKTSSSGSDFDWMKLLTGIAENVGAPTESSEWMELFDTVRQRAGNAGMGERSAEVDDFGLETSAVEAARPLFDFLLDSYWRARVLGAERLPRDKPVLFVANRAGIIPYDGLILAHALEREQLVGGRPRFLVADWLVTLPFAQANLARLGGVRACRENADRLLATGHSVIAFPEGMKGAAKLFRDRYRLQRFGRGGAVRAALENGVPLVPIGLAGPEEAHPVIARSSPLPARAAGLPFVPLTPTFPWLGPLGLLPLPTKWVIAIGEPLDLSEYAAEDAADPLLVDRLNEELRERIAERIRFALGQRDTVWG